MVLDTPPLHQEHDNNYPRVFLQSAEGPKTSDSKSLTIPSAIKK